MKPIDNSQNSLISPNDFDKDVSELACKWERPDFDANKNEIHNESESQSAFSIAADAKGILTTEVNLRRFVIDQDLNQPDMQKEKQNPQGIKQQILEYPSGN